MYLPLYGFVEKAWIAIQVISEKNYSCLYDWDQGAEFFLDGENPDILLFHWFWVQTQDY